MNFLSKNEKILEKEFIDQGFIIREVANKDALNKIHKLAVKILSKKGGDSLDNTHKNIDINELNDFRLDVINEINNQPWLREAYYQIAKPYLDVLVGNELAMQSRINLSIQLPNDNSSLLPVHTDTSEELFDAIKNEVNWIKINYGEVLVFNQAYPHGNVINKESETRWTMNCRFKGLFTPYKDKKIGEYYEPITLRPVSKVAMSYKFPITE